MVEFFRRDCRIGLYNKISSETTLSCRTNDSIFNQVIEQSRPAKLLSPRGYSCTSVYHRSIIPAFHFIAYDNFNDAN